VRHWDWTHERDGAWQPVPAADLLLLEGVGSGALACAPLLSGLVWLQAPPSLRRARALHRDGETYAPHWLRWASQERRYLRRDAPRRRADLVLGGAGAPRVLADRRGPGRGSR
jgi:hypothetical protein